MEYVHALAVSVSTKVYAEKVYVNWITTTDATTPNTKSSPKSLSTMTTLTQRMPLEPSYLPKTREKLNASKK
jgi:hypothetical protein